MAYAFRNKETFKATVNGKEYVINCYTQSTSYGFRHVAFLDGAWGETQIAKATYYNRTWERFTYETVLRNAIKKLPKADQQELYDILIERKAQKEHEECERQIKAFETLYNKTSDAFKERAKDLPLMQNESDVNAVKGLMMLDILMNN